MHIDKLRFYRVRALSWDAEVVMEEQKYPQRNSEMVEKNIFLD